MAEQAHEMGLEIREGTPGSEHDMAMVATADAHTGDFEDHRPARRVEVGLA